VRPQPGFEAHGQYLSQYLGSLFKSPELGRYALAGAPAASVGDLLPPEIRQLLGWPKQDSRMAEAIRAGPDVWLGPQPGRIGARLL
jgi:hypothetical protein